MAIFSKKNIKSKKWLIHFASFKKLLPKSKICDKMISILNVFVKIILRIWQSRINYGIKTIYQMLPRAFFANFSQNRDLYFGISLLLSNWYSKVELVLVYYLDNLQVCWQLFWNVGKGAKRNVTNKIFLLFISLSLSSNVLWDF